GEKFNVSKLVGAPPGYVGYEEGGQLTEKVRRRPYSVVLLDEIEKAHPEAFNILLQIMEEGHLSDAKGQKVNFRNAMIIMTSNVGADTIKRGPNLGFSFQRDEAVVAEESYREMQKKLLDELKRNFRPEFINRVDSIVVFRQLAQSDIRKIVDIILSEVNERLVDYELTLEVSSEARDWLAERGYDPEFGARPLRRLIQTEVEDLLSDTVLAGKFKHGETVVVDLNKEDDKVVLRHPDEEAAKETALGEVAT
ncbi:MAG: AAA family ATPase, partial [Anaerolineales bacterium]|nr:AAA family ATPase [Anaerolineales bacterium]